MTPEQCFPQLLPCISEVKGGASKHCVDVLIVLLLTSEVNSAVECGEDLNNERFQVREKTDWLISEIFLS